MGVHKILLVADRTAAEPHVVAALGSRAAEASIAVTLLVPATPPRRGWVWDESTSRTAARRRMLTAVANLRGAGVHATPVLGDFSPIDAIRDEMRRDDYDEIMISTLPTRTSRWLRMDLPARVDREFPVPVTHVQAGAEPTRLAPTRVRRSAA